MAVSVAADLSAGSHWSPYSDQLRQFRFATASTTKVYNRSADPSQASAELNQLRNMDLSGNKPRSTAVWIGATHHAIQENER